MSKATILTLVRRACDTDSAPIREGDLDPFLESALARYSRDRPYETVVDVTGAGSRLLSTPTGWQSNWSVIRWVIYPYEDADSLPIESDEYEVTIVPVSGSPVEKIRFANYEPAATETARVAFTAPHTLTASSCTVYSKDEAGFAHLVAYYIETKRASHFLGMSDSAVEADLVDYGGKAREAREQAKAHLAAYRQALGLPEGDKPTPAASALDMDVEPEYAPYVSHQRHHRRAWR